MTYKNKGKYTGEFRNNKRNGLGLFKNYDGKTYDGNWLDDKQHGVVKFTENGQTRFTKWQNGVLIKEISMAEFYDGKL